MSDQQVTDEQMRSIAHQAEQDLNSHASKVGHSYHANPPYDAQSKKGHQPEKHSLSATESGVDTFVENRFPGAKVTYGSAASGAGNNRVIPPEEGGDQLPGKHGGRPTKAGDFEGEGGPEDKARKFMEENPGADEIRSNIR